MASPGLSIAWSDRKRGALARKRQELLDPGGFLLIAWLARARAARSHAYPYGRGGVWRRARPGEHCAQPVAGTSAVLGARGRENAAHSR